jgi:hypothetical protein
METIMALETKPVDPKDAQPVVILPTPQPDHYVHPFAPDGYPTPGHKLAAEQEEIDSKADVDHLGRIEELATELVNATPSGANTISTKIHAHVRALRDPEAEKVTRKFNHDMKVERAKEYDALQNPDRDAGQKEAEASRQRQDKLQQDHSDALAKARENQQKAANTARDAKPAQPVVQPTPVVNPPQQPAPSRPVVMP